MLLTIYHHHHHRRLLRKKQHIKYTHMVLNGLFCADVPSRNYSLTHSCDYFVNFFTWRGPCIGLLPMAQGQ